MDATTRIIPAKNDFFIFVLSLSFLYVEKVKISPSFTLNTSSNKLSKHLLILLHNAEIYSRFIIIYVENSM